MNTKQYVKKALKNNRGRLIILVFFNLLISLAVVAFAYCSRTFIDTIVSQDDKWKIIGLILIAIIILEVLLKIFSSFLSAKIQFAEESSQKLALFKEITKKRYVDVKAYYQGDLVNLISNDTKIVAEGIGVLVPDLVLFVSRILAAFALLCYLDWLFAIILLVGGILTSVVTKLLRDRMKRYHERVQEKEGKNLQYFQESLTNLLVLKIFNPQRILNINSKNVCNELYQAKVERSRFSLFVNGGFLFVLRFSYVFALIWCGYKMHNSVEFTMGTLLAVLQLISQIQMPFTNLSGLLPKYYGVLASSERILKIYDLPDEIYHNVAYDKIINIEFKNVSFAYDRELILQDVNISFKKDCFYSLSGGSGEGKSTLLKLLMGVLTPTEGTINYRTKDGLIPSSPQDHLFAYVPQGNYIMSGTIRDNLLLFNENATEDELRRALELSVLTNAVNEFPQGLDEKLIDGREGLSEGQAQRLAVARAIISNAPIMIFDEATSAVDNETEERMLANLKQLKDKTIIFISHRQAVNKYASEHLLLTKKTIRKQEAL